MGEITRKDFYNAAGMVALAILVAAFIFNLSSIEERNKLANRCNEYIDECNRQIAKCQYCIYDHFNISDLQPESWNATEGDHGD